ncbi:MAG: efflux RND transporter permease subunit, partial [Candidatus Dormibacteraceae bacterium]
TTPVRLDQIATISQGAVPIDGISRTNGTPSLQIEVIKASNGNAVTLSKDIQHRMSGVQLNSADNLVLLSDSAQDIRASLNDLLLEGALGALLAILVIFFFLRSLRATLVTAISLPTSVLVALLGTALGGFSLNVLTLAGLTVAVGRIVDDAIVVLENSYRHLQAGESPMEATLHGTTEVSSAVISSTLTTVAVFLPIGLAGGIISRFFLPFSVTVTISLLASLLVALTLIPVLVSLVMQRKANSGSREIVKPYHWTLRTVVNRSWRKTVALALPIGLGGGIAARLFLRGSVISTVSLIASLLVILTLIPTLIALFSWRRQSSDKSEESAPGWTVRIYRRA